MAYNIELEKRIDFLYPPDKNLVKKKMFGGIAYLLNGNMCFGIHKDWLVIRTSPKKAEKILKDKNASVFDITGRPMKGWTMIEPEGIEKDSQLFVFLNQGKEFAASLPPK